MEILLKRTGLFADHTDGQLFVNGKYFCEVIEDTVRANPGEWKSSLKVHGKTAIPYGKYPVLVTWSNRFKRMLTAILNVPDFEGIRAHNGKSAESSEGCLILSYKRPFNYDRTAMNDLCAMVTKAQQTEKVWLEII